MSRQFAAGKKGGLPPFKEGEKIDLKIAHWCLWGPRVSGMYETVRELIFAENKIEGVLAGFCETPSASAGEPTVKKAAMGNKVDAMFPALRTQDWGWAMKWADIHMIHSTMSKQVGELAPKAFFHHGTPEATLANDLDKGSTSFKSGAAWTNRFDITFVTSRRAYEVWSAFDWSGEKVHIVDKGVDLDWWQRSTNRQELDGDPSILYGEIWRGIKHPLHLFYACKKIFEENPKMRLNVWGLNIKKDFWEDFIDWTGFNSFIGNRGLRGIVDYPHHWYTRGDVLVSPGLFGDTSRVQQESMACGCPVISWDSDPYGDQHAYKYAKSFDIQDLSDKIMDAYNEVLDDREEVARRCRNIAEQYFDVNKEAQQIVSNLRSVIETF